MVNSILALIFISLLAPTRTVIPDATKNRKSQVSRQSKSKRTVKRRRGNIKRRKRNRHKKKYTLTRRRKAGGTFNQNRRKSRATNNTNKRVRKNNTNRRRRKSHVQDTTKKGYKDSARKASPRSRSSGRLSPLQREMLRFKMQILLSDPELGPIYRQILRESKKEK